METTITIANRFREVILNGTWISNTNYKKELQGLDWQVAISKINDLNSIAAIAQHIHYYIKGVMNVLIGGGLDIKDKYSFDFLPINSQLQWEDFLKQFWTDAEKFASLIESLPGQQLKEVFADERYGTYQRNLEGIIEHSYYHLGQVVLLKKILVKPNS